MMASVTKIGRAPGADQKMVIIFLNTREFPLSILRNSKKVRSAISQVVTGGRRGIRTLGRLLTYARVPGVCLKPLGHPSVRALPS